MKNIHILVYLVLFMISITTLRSSHHKTPIKYNQTQYINTLAQKQDNFKKQMLQIDQQIQQINKIIDHQNSTIGYKLYKLQQAMADQRDSLYKIQNDLVLPFSLKKCDCLDLTDQKVQQISQKITSVQTHIQNLQKTVNQCNQCPNLKQIQQQILQQKQYLLIIKATLNADCCWVPKQMPIEKPSGLVSTDNMFYKNNLTKKNWFYGSTTEEKYKYQTFIRATQYNLTSCSGQTPFVKKDKNSCFGCPKGAAYNIGDQKCISCPLGFYFNYAAQRCDFCGQKMIFNTTLEKCAFCSQGFKFDNITETGCVQISPKNQTNGTVIHPNCTQQTPFLNPNTNECQPCMNGTEYSQEKKECVQTNYIGLCPLSLPFYNISSNRCQACPKGTVYNSQTYHCVEGGNNGGSQNQNNTGNGTQTNPSNNTTQNNSTTGNQTVQPNSKCTIDQTYNKQQDKCISTQTLCTAEQYYDKTLHQCASKSSLCSVDQAYDAKNQICRKVPFVTSPYMFNLVYQDKDFKNYIDLYNDSKQKNPDLKDCPLVASYFSPSLLKCISCPSNEPLFNLDTGKCFSCPHPTIYNPTKHKCQKMDTSGHHHQLGLLLDKL